MVNRNHQNYVRCGTIRTMPRTVTGAQVYNLPFESQGDVEAGELQSIETHATPETMYATSSTPGQYLGAMGHAGMGGMNGMHGSLNGGFLSKIPIIGKIFGGDKKKKAPAGPTPAEQRAMEEAARAKSTNKMILYGVGGAAVVGLIIFLAVKKNSRR